MGEDPLSWSHGPVGLSEETHRPVSQWECDSGWTEFIKVFSETLVYISIRKVLGEGDGCYLQSSLIMTLRVYDDVLAFHLRI